MKKVFSVLNKCFLTLKCVLGTYVLVNSSMAITYFRVFLVVDTIALIFLAIIEKFMTFEIGISLRYTNSILSVVRLVIGRTESAVIFDFFSTILSCLWSFSHMRVMITHKHFLTRFWYSRKRYQKLKIEKKINDLIKWLCFGYHTI